MCGDSLLSLIKARQQITDLTHRGNSLNIVGFTWWCSKVGNLICLMYLTFDLHSFGE